jgi:hypothetical protein
MGGDCATGLALLHLHGRSSGAPLRHGRPLGADHLANGPVPRELLTGASARDVRAFSLRKVRRSRFVT